MRGEPKAAIGTNREPVPRPRDGDRTAAAADDEQRRIQVMATGRYTVTADPSARNAESGGRESTSAKSRP